MKFDDLDQTSFIPYEVWFRFAVPNGVLNPLIPRFSNQIESHCVHLNSYVGACALVAFGTICRSCRMPTLDIPTMPSLRSGDSIRPAPGELLASESALEVFTFRVN